MTLQQLKYVTAIADSGSVSSAAKNLYISQPSLSSAVKELEEEVGFSLFLRSNRGWWSPHKGRNFSTMPVRSAPNTTCWKLGL